MNRLLEVSSILMILDRMLLVVSKLVSLANMIIKMLVGNLLLLVVTRIY